MSGLIKYKKGYKYQLAEDYAIELEIYPVRDIFTDMIWLNELGKLRIMAGYAWDGASGPTIDTKSSMRGSLVHDALYQLMREGYLGLEWREKADHYLRSICRDDGMSWFRARLWEKAVDWFAKRSASEAGKRPLLTAP